MKLKEVPLQWFIDKLKEGQFCYGRYGDGEFQAIFGRRTSTTIGTRLTPELSKALRKSLEYRHPNFYFSAPWVAEHQRSRLFGGDVASLADIEWILCDVLDRETRLGNLGPFIKQLQQHKLCIIGNEHHRKLHFLQYDSFIEIHHNNCFGDMDKILNAAQRLIGYTFVVSAGPAAALIVQGLQKRVSKVSALDVGSIWDAFVGIGAQRGWRRELYADKDGYESWKEKYREVGYGG